MGDMTSSKSNNIWSGVLISDYNVNLKEKVSKTNPRIAKNISKEGITMGFYCTKTESTL